MLSNIKQFFVQREYRPAWLFRIPLLFMRAWYACKARHPFFFSVVNPAIPGGFMKEKKSFTYTFLPQSKVPQGCTIQLPNTIETIHHMLESYAISMPFVIKPDGDSVRGDNVYIVSDADELVHIIAKVPSGEYLFQEFIGGEEYSIYYYSHPWEKKGHILGITKKEYPRVIGDGIHTVGEIIGTHDRYKRYYSLFANTYKVDMNYVPKVHEKVAIAHIGNHCKGSMFLDWSSHSTDTLLENMDSLFGDTQIYMYRLDVKTRSQQHLLLGEFIILEVNAGVFAEPTFVYDPAFKLIDAYRAFAKVWQVAYDISIYNHTRLNIPYITYKQGYKFVCEFLSK